MSKTKKKKEVKQQYTVKNAVVNYYLLLMLTVFPLFYTNAHINIRHDKLYMFYALSGALIACMLLILLVYFTERKNRPDDGTRKWYLQLSVTDYAFGAFALCCVFSTVLSEYPWYAFRGIWYASTGRNNGLLLMENPDLADGVAEGQVIRVEVGEKIIAHGRDYPVAALPRNLLDILNAGGLVSAMRRRNGLPDVKKD